MTKPTAPQAREQRFSLRSGRQSGEAVRQNFTLAEQVPPAGRRTARAWKPSTPAAFVTTGRATNDPLSPPVVKVLRMTLVPLWKTVTLHFWPAMPESISKAAPSLPAGLASALSL